LITLIEAAGWPIWPLIIASVISLAIIFERTWSLRVGMVMPSGVFEQIAADVRAGKAAALSDNISPLGQVLAAGVATMGQSRELMKEALEETGRAVAHDLSRYLTTLGTIASVSPLLGLLGTVIGMVEIFGSQTPSGGNPAMLAHGISVALYNTAFGLIVAIPSMIAYRHFRAKVDALLVEMEQRALHLVDLVHGKSST
jgi:biopolymer transport protein ExbB